MFVNCVYFGDENRISSRRNHASYLVLLKMYVMTEHFFILKPESLWINESHSVQKRRSKDCEAGN